MGNEEIMLEEMEMQEETPEETVDRMTDEGVIDNDDGTKELAALVVGGVLLGIGAKTVIDKWVAPGVKKAFGWVKSKIPHKKDDAPAEEPAPEPKTESEPEPADPEEDQE